LEKAKQDVHPLGVDLEQATNKEKKFLAEVVFEG
jgi:hypothetical protein